MEPQTQHVPCPQVPQQPRAPDPLKNEIRATGINGLFFDSIPQTISWDSSSWLHISLRYIPRSDSKKGLIKLRVIEAKNLERIEAKLVDPYVKIFFGKKKFKTSAIRQNSNPIWNEFFEIDVPQKHIPSHLIFQMWYFDRFGSDHFLGECSLPFSQLFVHNEIIRLNKWYPLSLCSSDSLLRKIRHLPHQQTISDMLQYSKQRRLRREKVLTSESRTKNREIIRAIKRQRLNEIKLQLIQGGYSSALPKISDSNTDDVNYKSIFDALLQNGCYELILILICEVICSIVVILWKDL
jgi:hypothetical protein